MKLSERLTKEKIQEINEKYYITYGGEIRNRNNHKLKRGTFIGGHPDYENNCGYEYLSLCGILMGKHRWLMLLAGRLNKKNLHMVVNHKNGNIEDNSLENLEVITNEQNLEHARIRKVLVDNGILPEDFKLSYELAIRLIKTIKVEECA